MTTRHARRWLIAIIIPLCALRPIAERAGAQQIRQRERPRVAQDTLVALSAGNATTCVTVASATAYCWGDLGERRGKVYTVLGADGRPARLRSASPGWLNLCAETIDGEAACDPSLADASTDSAGKWKHVTSCDFRLCVLPLPKDAAMPVGPLRAVDAGWDHACALALDGSAFCWGRNDQGQLGNGSWAPDSTGSAGQRVRVPTAVATAHSFASLSAGENTTCGITEAGAAIYCWGYGQSGQTGDSSVTTYCTGVKPYYNKTCSNAVPSRVRVETRPGARSGADVRFAQVSVGMRLACAVSTTGDAYCWGGNYRCALGRCGEGDSPLAHKIALAGRVAEIGAGYWHACARTVDLRIFCWGQNSEGQLGSMVSANLGADGMPPDYRDTTNREAQTQAYYDDPCFLGGRCSPVPVEVSPGRRWSKLTVGSEHACALADDDGGVYCWGGTDAAAVGLGSSLVPCVNHSMQWKDVRCQVTPVRVPGLPRLISRPASVARRRTTSTASSGVRVTVSRRMARVVFPRDTSTAWGWSALVDPEYQPSYHWSISVEGMDGPRSLQLLVSRTGESARRFVSLDSLVAAGRPSRCTPGMIAQCSSTNVSASVEEGHVVLALTDSAEIARLFGMRPATVGVWSSRPSELPHWPPTSAAVEYVEPLLPLPNAAMTADARASRRRYEASISTITRQIAGDGDQYGTALWLSVGDSLSLSVEESHCHYDSCMAKHLPLGDSLWTLDDTTVAGLRAAASSRASVLANGASMRLVGRKPGRTIVRITLPPLASDTAPASSPPKHALTREVVVTRPIRRIAFGPHPDSVRVGETIELRVRATDDQGRQYDNPPARVMVNDGDRSYVTLATDPIRVSFASTGTRTIVARYGVLADTLALRVVRVP